MNRYYEKVSAFCSDYFFHYLMYNCENLRRELCQYLSHDDVVFTNVEYSDTYASIKNGRKYVMDIVVKDDQGRYYNFEMQNGDISDNDLKRFQIYAMRLVERQINNRVKIEDVHTVRQLIIYTGRVIHRFEHYQHKVQLYDKEYQNLLKKGLIVMNFIQTQKMEEIEMETMNEVHEVMKLFANEENHEKEQKSELAKEVVEKYKQFMASDEYIAYLQMERDRWVIEYRMDEAKEKGLVEGKRNEKLKDIKMVIQSLYQENQLEWLDSCTYEQLEAGFKLIFNGLNYNELKKQIQDDMKVKH